MVNHKQKILLVNPACLDYRISGEDARITPIGLYYIGAYLMENGFKVTIVNLADTKDNPVDLFNKLIALEKPDIIGFSVINPNRHSAMECAKNAKKVNPDVTIVFGGPAPTFLADHFFAACPQIDFIVTGEGELTFLKLVKTLSKGRQTSFENINGLVFKKDDTICKTRQQAQIDNLDSLAHPSRYFTYQHLSLSRGCPGKCTFCGSPKFWGSRKVRFHSPEWFADEIQALVEKGVHHFYISDDTFTMDKQRVIKLCSLIEEKKLNITWNAISRVDYIDDGILCAMRKAGCIQLSFGVESGSEKIRKKLGKPMDQDKIIKAFSLTASYGIMPRAYFIYGSPGETAQTIKESIELLRAIKPLSAIFYMLVVFPGTHLYQSAVQKKALTDDLWHQKIEDLPWFEIDASLDFSKVKNFGDRLRSEFYNNLDSFGMDIKLADIKQLYPYHADFLSRLAMTFSHGEYANDTRIKNQDKTAEELYKKALSYAPDSRAFLGFAMLQQKLKKFDKAVAILEKGLAYWPDNRDLNLCMGISLMNMGRFSAALAVFEKFGHFPDIKHYINICRQHIKGTRP